MSVANEMIAVASCPTDNTERQCACNSVGTLRVVHLEGRKATDPLVAQNVEHVQSLGVVN